MDCIRVERKPFPAGFASDWHGHGDAQLIYPRSGAMALETQAGVWVVPPQQACWLPNHHLHRVRSSTGFEMYSVYCRGPVLTRLPGSVGIVGVSGLLRETIMALGLGPKGRRFAALARLFTEEVHIDGPPALFLPQLTSRHLKTIEATLASNPGCDRTLAEWAIRLGASPRTLARAFTREANMSFTAYRRQARLRAGLIRMADGAPLTQVALDLSFGSASNFIRAFRRTTGATPRMYLGA